MSAGAPLLGGNDGKTKRYSAVDLYRLLFFAQTKTARLVSTDAALSTRWNESGASTRLIESRNFSVASAEPCG